MRSLYCQLRALKKKFQSGYRCRAHYRFINRKKDQEKLCILLAGYKPFLYPVTFKRLAAFLDDDIDMCIISSGLYSKKLEDLCREHSWSYLSTKENNVSLVQNLAIKLHPAAEYIYKLDEDIFVTSNYFSTLFHTLEKVEKEGEYFPGFVAPVIPVNGYGHMRVLKKLGLEEEYARRFEAPRYAAGPDRMIECNPEAAKFFWGEGGVVPGIDELDRIFHEQEFTYSVCPIRFSIGAVLFKRKVWEDMGMFSVSRRNNAMGRDELELCSVAMKDSKAIIISENTVVGHLSFGRQNEVMKQYFLDNLSGFSEGT